MKNRGRTRRILITALLVLLGGTVGSGTGDARTIGCYEDEVYGSRFCNDGGPMLICDLGEGMC